MKCRLCKSNKLTEFLDLGHHPPSDQFIKKKDINSQFYYYPLKVVMCEKCKFHQLNHVVDKEVLYNDDYPYESSKTKLGHDHFNDFALSVIKNYNLNSKDLVIDIGSNVGVLLDGFKKNGVKVLGIEPAKNISKIANKRKIKTITSFFDKKVLKKIKPQFGMAKVITATNVFAHIDDLHLFMKNICFILKRDGVFIIEAPQLLYLLKKVEFDTIYHEHLSYLSIQPLSNFFKKFNLEITNVEKKDIHGGSIRIHVSFKKQFNINPSVRKVISEEKKYKIDNKAVLKNFAKKVVLNRMKLTRLLINLKLKNKKIVALSAPAKGMTLLNYCKIDKDFIDFATEKSSLKRKLFTPGTLIPVTSDSQIIKSKVDYALLLAWNFSKEIINNNIKFLKKGGKIIIPVPKVKIIDIKNYKS